MKKVTLGNIVHLINDEFDIYYDEGSDRVEQMYEEITNVVEDIDFENFGYSLEDCNFVKDHEKMFGPQEVNGRVFCGAFCGGDWQNPMFVALYFDDEDNLRAYVPIEGNVLAVNESGNYIAYETPDYDPDIEERPKDPDFDYDKIKADLASFFK